MNLVVKIKGFNGISPYEWGTSGHGQSEEFQMPTSGDQQDRDFTRRPNSSLAGEGRWSAASRISKFPGQRQTQQSSPMVRENPTRSS